MSYLRFDYPNVGFVIDGLEDATVRYEFERELEEGERVKLLTPEGNRFGTAVIEEIWTCPLRLAFFDMTVADGRNHPAKNGLDLQKRLWTHYPKARPSDDDEVTFIYFDLIEVGGPRRQASGQELRTDGGISISREELEKRKYARSTTPNEERNRCPECGSTNITRKTGKWGSGSLEPGRWYCKDASCLAHFDNPVQGEDPR